MMADTLKISGKDPGSEKEIGTVKVAPRPSAYERNASLHGKDTWAHRDTFRSFVHEYLFLLSVALAQIMTQSSTMNPMAMVGVLTKHFNSNADEANWLMAAFPLASGTFVLISGRIGDVYGLERTVTCGYLWFIVWSLLVGVSYYVDSKFFIVARAFQGLGIAFVLPNVMGMLGSSYKPGTGRKNMVFAIIGAAPPIGGCIGMFFGGLIATETKRWDWAYYSLVILGVIGLSLALVTMPSGLPRNPHKVKMDWIGSVLGVTALVLFNFCWNEAPSKGWQTGYLIALLVLSVVIFVLFWVYEIYYASSPLIPRSLYSGGMRVPLALLSTFLGWGAFSVYFYYYFRFIMELRHYSPVWAGGTMWVAIVSGVLSSLSVGYLLRYFYVEIILVVSLIGFMAPNIIMLVTPVHQTFWRNTFGALLIQGIGMDWSYPASSVTLSDALPRDAQGMAGSLVSTATNYAVSLFLGFAGLIEKHTNKNGADLLHGYRVNFGFALGVAGLGAVMAVILLTLRILQGPPSDPHFDLEPTDILESAENSSPSSPVAGLTPAETPGDVTPCSGVLTPKGMSRTPSNSTIVASGSSST